VADVGLGVGDLIQPLFVGDLAAAHPVASMVGVSQLPVRVLASRGLRQFLLFGVTAAGRKDAVGSYAASADAPVNRVLAGVREAGLDVLMYADVCLCEYTDHGHCGVLGEAGTAGEGVVDNDRTLEVLAGVAVAQARSGADVVAPSGMMDGQVAAIRGALDGDGRQGVAILSYSIKYASSFYGPFRDAGEGGMKFGDRCGYQMDFRRSREWRAELEADLAEGADMVMVKPAATYLDVLHEVRGACSVPVVGYHVSGECAMLAAAAERGWLSLKEGVLETSYAIKRAGADLIVTYFADRLLEWL
jgi:porphobilinogen synthase